MKKYFILAACCGVHVLGNFSALAYTSLDVQNANALAAANIIVDNSANIAAYRLDDTISRQEVTGIAIKMLDVPLSTQYTCQGYYSDVYFPVGHSDAWVCRSIEIAADNGLISRANTVFRPKDSITRAEALAIIMKASNIIYPKNVTLTFEGQPTSRVYPATTPQWQIDLIEGAKSAQVLTFDTYENTYNVFMPDHSATRANVFEYTYKVMNREDVEEQEIAGTFTYKTSNTVLYVDAGKDLEITLPDNYLLYEEEKEYDTFMQDVFFAKSNDDDIVLSTVIVGHEPCTACDKTDLVSLKAGEEFGSGTIRQKVSDTLYIIDGENDYTTTRAYIKYTFNTKTGLMHYVIATTTASDWEKYKKELLTIVNSLKVYK